MTENELATIVVNVAFQIHQKLGPGLFESVYQSILIHELVKQGLVVESEVPLQVTWDELQMGVGFKLDLLVEKKLVIELKSIDAIAPVHKKQLLTYLRLSGCRLGLLINFGEGQIKNGICRVVNGLEDFQSR